VDGPLGVAVDGAGNVFIVDPPRVRKVSPSGIITTVAGSGVTCYTGGGHCGGFSGDGGPATSALLLGPSYIAVDALGNLFISDTGNQRIRRVSPDGIIITVPLHTRVMLRAEGISIAGSTSVKYVTRCDATYIVVLDIGD